MKTVTAAVVYRNGSVLLTRRGPDEKLAGFWEFPGGKVEPWESLEDIVSYAVNLHPLRIRTVSHSLKRTTSYGYPGVAKIP